MLATRVRERPCSSLARRSSLGRLTASSPFSAFSTVIGSATVCDSSPLGPLTLTVWPVMVTSTPAGTGIDLRPIRDMSKSPLPNEGEDFPANAPLAGLPVGQQPLGRRNDRDAQAAEHPRELVGLGVHPEAGLRNALDAGEAALAVLAVLELNDQTPADGAFLRLLGRPGGDVTLGLEDLGDVRLDLREGHGHLVVVRLVGVTQTGQHVCDRVRHRHGYSSTFLAGVPGAGSRPTAKRYYKSGLPGS